MNIKAIGLRDRNYELYERKKVSNTLREGINDGIFLPLTEREFDHIVKKENIHERVKDGNIEIYDYTNSEKTKFTKLDKIIPQIRSTDSKKVEYDEEEVGWITESMIGTIILTAINLDLPIIFVDKECCPEYELEKDTKERMKNIIKSKFSKNNCYLYTNSYNKKFISDENTKSVSKDILKEIKNYDSLEKSNGCYTIPIEDYYIPVFKKLVNEESPRNVFEYKII